MWQVTTLEVALLRPWPVDVDRIVANEIADAEQTVALYTPALDIFWSSQGPLGSRPTKADHERARQEFRDRLPDYAERLRAWLEEYTAAARARADTFDLTLELENARDGGHAEAVHVVVELPPTVKVVEERATMPLPPEPPRYQPPRPRAPFDSSRAFARVSPIDVSSLAWTPNSVLNPTSEWRERDNGRVLEVSAGDVHASRSVALGDSLLVRADGAGKHELRWTVYTNSARQPTIGTLTLIVSPDAARPAFGRLRGITSYPDVPLRDDEGEIVHDVRTADPPRRPEPQDERDEATSPKDVVWRLRDRRAEMEWHALGLDPANDGPLDKTTPDDVRRVDR